MTGKRTLVGGGCAHFVTFSTFGRRRLLATSVARRIVMTELNRLAEADRVQVAGFVVMPDHVHALLWFDDDRRLPEAMNVWKATGARELRKWYEATRPEMIDFLHVARSGRERVSFWQRRYHDLNVWSNDKARQKIDYMHYNPVKAGLCGEQGEWLWSSWRWYNRHEDVGVKMNPGF